MKIVTVIGARPQFIKAAAVSRKLRINNEEILVHSGQHYDVNMSENFFKELNIPIPDYNLCAGSGSHAVQTATILMRTEEILFKENPDFLLVYGDTNTTLAAALAASKINIPVIHVEAGLRSFNFAMPEEQNRVLTDHISKILFCPSNVAKNNLSKENINDNVFVVGDVMCDAVMYYSRQLNRNKNFYISQLKGMFDIQPEIDTWYLATIHRAENTNDINKLHEILLSFECLDHIVIFPVHPRIKMNIQRLNSTKEYKNIFFVEPVGYLEMLYLTMNAVKVLTDSGGLQKEAYILGTPCVTIREQTEWLETLNGNLNVLAHVEKNDIINKTLYVNPDFTKKDNYYGTGDSADQICKILDDFN